MTDPIPLPLAEAVDQIGTALAEAAAYDLGVNPSAELPDLFDLIPALEAVLGYLTPGVVAIASERRRQITAEGYTPEHDAGHAPQLFDAAGEYATAASVATLTAHGATLPVPFGWPWEAGFWKPSADPIKNARRSGAMLAAGIDSLLAEQGPTKEN